MLGFIKKLFGPRVDLSKKMSEGAIIVDVRSPEEYAGGHVKGSKNIPLDKISVEIEAIKKWNKPVITCCAIIFPYYGFLYLVSSVFELFKFRLLLDHTSGVYF